MSAPFCMYHKMNIMYRKVLSLSLTLLSVSCFANFEKDGFSMFIQDGGIILSSAIGEMEEDLVISDSIEYEGKKYPVTKLGGGLFMYHDEIKKVTIPSTIIFMGSGALAYCNNLKEIVIEDGENDIDCYGNTFSHSPIEKIYLGRGLKPENDYKVLFTSSVKHMTVGPKVTSLTNCYAVSDLSSLKIEDSETPCTYSIQFHSDSIYVGREMVSDERSMHGAFTGECKHLQFSPNVTDIDNYFFSNFNIDIFVLPATVTRLRRDAFYNCYINNMVIEQSENPIILDSYDAFYRTEIDSLYIGRELVYTDDSYGAFSPRTNRILKYVYMENNVVNISRAAFQYDNYITYVRFSPLVETIPGACFDHSGAIRDLVMPTSLKTVEYSAFSNCGIDIADFSNTKLETIGRRAFYCALGLTKIVLPSTITQIGDEALAWCSKLNEIIIYSKQVPTIYDGTFYNTTLSNITLKVPEDMVEAYKADSQWKKIKNIVPIETSSISSVELECPISNSVYNIGGYSSTTENGIIIVPTAKGYKKYIKRRNK